MNSFPPTVSDKSICTITSNSLCDFVVQIFSSDSRTITLCDPTCSVTSSKGGRRLDATVEKKVHVDFDVSLSTASEADPVLTVGDLGASLSSNVTAFNEIYVKTAATVQPGASISDPSKIMQVQYVTLSIYSSPSLLALVRSNIYLLVAAGAAVLGIILFVISMFLACGRPGSNDGGSNNTRPGKYSISGPMPMVQNPMGKQIHSTYNEELETRGKKTEGNN